MMKSKTINAISIVLLILVGAGTFFFTHNKNTNSAIPTLSLRSGDASASAEFLNAQKAAEYYREEIRKKPDDPKNYIQLAQLFLQEARVTARHHEYVPKAQFLIDEALKRDPDNFEARITKASMLMTLHHFEKAKEIAEKAITGNPYNAFAYGVLCDALVELGKYDEAVQTCDKMLSVRPDLRSYARASYLRELHGDLDGARSAMKLAADAGVSGQENRAWVLYNLAKLYANQGKLDTAEFILKGTLDERPDYAFALSGLAEVRSARGRTDEAIELLSKAAERTPEHSILEQLADIYLATGQKEAAEGTSKLVLQAFEQHEKGGWNVDKEYALFCANHVINLDEALQRAEREYKRRSENVSVLETYAWTLCKNDRATEAVPFIERAMRLNTKNAVLLYHAGMIFQKAGQLQKARTSLNDALALNPYLNVLCAQSARTALASLTGLASQ